MKTKFILLFLFSGILLFGQTSKLSPYTASFLNSLQNVEESSGILLRKQFQIKKLNETEYIKAFIELENSNTEKLTSLGVMVNATFTDKLISAQIPLNVIEDVVQLPDIKRIEMGIPVHNKMNYSRDKTNVDAVHIGTGLDMPYTGKDVVVGIIDTGFEYGHVNFYSEDGNEYRIKRVWDQNINTGTSPDGYSYGAEYTTQEEILAVKYDYDTDETHGTHVAGIAAGAYKRNDNPYYGIATGADIVLVSYELSGEHSNHVSIAEGIKYIYDYAESVNKPCVINMSLGSHIGPHDGSSTFDKITDMLQGEGKILVGACGNEGGSKIHVSTSYTGNNDTLKTFLDFVYPYYSASIIDIWGDANQSYEIQLSIYNESTNTYTFQTEKISAHESSDTTIRLRNQQSDIYGAKGVISITTEKADNEKGNAYIAIELSSINANHQVELRIIPKDNGTIHAWAYPTLSVFTNNNKEDWQDGDIDYTVGEIGGTGNNIITVGAYVSKNKFTNINNSFYNMTDYIVEDIASFSSKGPTVDNRMKPIVTAPGAWIISSFSSAVRYNNSYSQLYVSSIIENDTNYYFGGSQGTSMSAPAVTGIIALWLEADKNLTPDEVKNIIKETAINDSYTGQAKGSGSNTWGYGKIDALKGIKSILNIEDENTAICNNEIYNSNILIYPNPVKNGKINIILPENEKEITVGLYTLNGQLIKRNQITSMPNSEVILEVNDLPKGIYTLYISGNTIYRPQKLVIQ